jgi:hypothetical protein
MKQVKIQHIIKELSSKMNMNKAIKDYDGLKIPQHKKRDKGFRTEQ